MITGRSAGTGLDWFDKMHGLLRDWSYSEVPKVIGDSKKIDYAHSS